MKKGYYSKYFNPDDEQLEEVAEAQHDTTKPPSKELSTNEIIRQIMADRTPYTKHRVTGYSTCHTARHTGFDSADVLDQEAPTAPPLQTSAASPKPQPIKEHSIAKAKAGYAPDPAPAPLSDSLKENTEQQKPARAQLALASRSRHTRKPGFSK